MKKLFLLLFILFPYFSFSAVQSMYTSITRMLATANGGYGGCMIASKWNIMEETGLNCNQKWVSLGCSSSVISEEDGKTMWRSAKIAFFMEQEIIIWVNDEIKHNGFCTVVRIDVLPQEQEEEVL